MTETILNTEGLDKLLAGRRYRLAERLRRFSKPVSYQGNFVGIGFRDYAKALEVISIIPEESRREKAKAVLDQFLKPMFGCYVLGAAFVDPFLDAAAGVA